MQKLKVDVVELFRLWRSPLRNDELADALGCPRGSLHYLAARYKLPKRTPEKWAKRTGAKRDLPTPQEIADRAAAIRATWSEEEKERRMVGKRTRSWQMPAYAFARRDVAFVEINLD